MRLYDILAEPVVTVSANDYAASALELIRMRGVSKVFVLDRDEIAGVIFKEDVIRQSESWLQERDAREVMTTDLQVVSPEFDSGEAERMLHLGGFACLVVHDGRQIQGAVTREDLRPRFSVGRSTSKGGRYASHSGVR